MNWQNQYSEFVQEVEINPITKITVVSDISTDVFAELWDKVVDENPQVNQEVIFLNLHLTAEENDYRFHCNGVKVLEQIIAEEPNRFVLVFSPLLTLREVVFLSQKAGNPILHLLEKNPMVQYLNIIPPSKEKVLKALERALEFSLQQSLTEIAPDLLTSGEVLIARKSYQGKISRLIHDLGHRSQVAFEEAKKLFHDLPDDMGEAREFLQARKPKKNELPPELQGKTVQGLFVDVAGTLFNSDFVNLNQELAKKILEQSKQHWVYVWTGGDLQQANKALGRHKALNDIVLLPKQAFTGLTVEETIDDLTETELEKEFGVRTLKHCCA